MLKLPSLWLREAMANRPQFECDLVLPGVAEALATVWLPVVPRVGETIELELAGPEARHSGRYDIVGLTYHVRPRRFGTESGGLMGLSLTVARAAEPGAGPERPDMR